jgi:hypothetical protein
VKTTQLAEERITVELTEFEMTALAALVERAQKTVVLARDEKDGIRAAIHAVADEFRSLLGHFELTADREIH